VIPIRDERTARGWTVLDMARKLRAAAADPRDIPALDSLIHNIWRWERGHHHPSERYRLLYCRALGRTEPELFGGPLAADPAAGLPAAAETACVVLVLPPGSRQVIISVTADEDDPSAAPGQPPQPAPLTILPRASNPA